MSTPQFQSTEARVELDGVLEPMVTDIARDHGSQAAIMPHASDAYRAQVVTPAGNAELEAPRQVGQELDYVGVEDFKVMAREGVQRAMATVTTETPRGPRDIAIELEKVDGQWRLSSMHLVSRHVVPR